MARLQQKVTESQGVTLASGVTTLALPPPSYATVPPEWNADKGVVPRFELEVWADAPLNLTAAELFGACPHAKTLADKTISSVNAGTNQLHSVGHGLFTADGPLVLTADATAHQPGGLVAYVASSLDLGTVCTGNVDTVIRAKEPSSGADGDAITVTIVGGAGAAAGVLTEDAAAKTVTLQVKLTATATTVAQLETLIGTSTLIEVLTPDATGSDAVLAGDVISATHLAGGVTGSQYWAIKVDADNVELAASRFDALNGTAIDVTSTGSGTLKLADVPGSTERVYWHSFGLLGPEGDGAIALDANKAYLSRSRHSPRALAYAMSATFDGAVALSAKIYPQVDR